MSRPLAALMALLAAGPATAETPAAIFDLLCGRTLQYYSLGLGNQIEYTSPDGMAYLWYPGLSATVTGTWSVEEVSPGLGEVCFTYPPGSFGLPNGAAHCFDYGALTADLVDGGIRDGDPFDLATESVPFTLPVAPELAADRLREDYPNEDRGAACAAFVS